MRDPTPARPLLVADWERFDRWTLFTEPFVLAVSESHPYADRRRVTMEELRGERIIRRSHCERLGDVEALLKKHGLIDLQRHEASSEVDVVGLLSANMGVALVPASADLPGDVRRLCIEDANLEREVCVLYSFWMPATPRLSACAAGRRPKSVEARSRGKVGAGWAARAMAI